MFSLIFTKRVPRSQARQFASFFVGSTSRIDSKLIQHSTTNVNCSGLINRNHRTYNRLFSNATNESYFLPPLMNIPLIKFPSLFYWYKQFVFSVYVRQSLDKTFSIQEFSAGAKHVALRACYVQTTRAIKIISNALSIRNYETLSGLVDEITIEIIQKKVDTLASAQRRLIAIDDATLSGYVNYDLRVKDGRASDCDFILEISQLGFYLPESQYSQDLDGRIFSNENGMGKLSLIMFNYTFQRNYKNGIGGPWIATVVNHFSITS